MKFSYHKLIYFLFLFCLTSLFGQESAELHPWTDLNGRTLQAKFIKGNNTSVTIEWNGQRFDLPMDTLSDQSKALAKKFMQKSASFEKVMLMFSSGKTLQVEPFRRNLSSRIN